VGVDSPLNPRVGPQIIGTVRHGRINYAREVTATTADEYAALFPHLARICGQILTDFADKEFTYADLRRVGIWPGEASTALSYLAEQWGRIEVVGLDTFRVKSTAPIDEYCPKGAVLGGVLAEGHVVIAFSVEERYRGNLENAGRDFVRAAIPAFGSLLDDQNEGGPVRITVFPTSDVVQVSFTTKRASLGEIAGFERWAELKSLEFGSPV